MRKRLSKAATKRILRELVVDSVAAGRPIGPGYSAYKRNVPRANADIRDAFYAGAAFMFMHINVVLEDETISLPDWMQAVADELADSIEAISVVAREE